MILSDETIANLCQTSALISPYDLTQLQPASYDLTLLEAERYWLLPHEFILASTIEVVTLPSDIVGRMEGKSSLARLGLIVHTAGFVDPGFKGQLTLEITNLSNKTIYLAKGMRIAQIAFSFLDQPCIRPYGHKDLNSHYQYQTGITHSILC